MKLSVTVALLSSGVAHALLLPSASQTMRPTTRAAVRMSDVKGPKEWKYVQGTDSAGKKSTYMYLGAKTGAPAPNKPLAELLGIDGTPFELLGDPVVRRHAPPRAHGAAPRPGVRIASVCPSSPRAPHASASRRRAPPPPQVIALFTPFVLCVPFVVLPLLGIPLPAVPKIDVFDVISRVTSPLGWLSGQFMKTLFDVWNLICPLIGLGGATLKY